MSLQQKKVEENILENSKIQENLTDIKTQRAELEASKILEIEEHQKEKSKEWAELREDK